MRWIPVDMTDPAAAQRAEPLLARAADRVEDALEALERDGLDSARGVPLMAEAGQWLFRAAAAASPGAFAAIPGAGGDAQAGLQLRVGPELLGLPWNWMHNGLRFLVETSPVCAGPSAPSGSEAWRRRRDDVAFVESALGPASLEDVLNRLRPEDCAAPEILFLPGSAGPAESREREADRIRDALAGRPAGRPLANLTVTERAPTPYEVVGRGPGFQGMHYAGNTVAPPPPSQGGLPAGMRPAEGETPLSGNLAVAEGGADEATSADPVAALLLEVAVATRTTRRRSRRARPSPAPVAEWRLEDGPVRPEAFAAGAPPFVFSNSYRSVQALGGRFLAAGSVAFLGTQAPVDAAVARRFAADCYRALAGGAGVAAACRVAALACRAGPGGTDPAWLAFGMVGCGDLAFQFL